MFVMCMYGGGGVCPAYTPRSVVLDLFSFSTVRKIDFSRCPGDPFLIRNFASSGIENLYKRVQKSSEKVDFFGSR